MFNTVTNATCPPPCDAAQGAGREGCTGGRFGCISQGTGLGLWGSQVTAEPALGAPAPRGSASSAHHPAAEHWCLCKADVPCLWGSTGAASTALGAALAAWGLRGTTRTSPCGSDHAQAPAASSGCPPTCVPSCWPCRLRVSRVVAARQELSLRSGAVSEVSGLLTAPPEPGGSPAHPKSPFTVTSHDLKLKQGSMNNVMRSFFSSCLQILRG